jgi:polygalacturonase
MSTTILNLSHVNDGQVDATEVLQHKIDECKPYETIVIPKGEYLVGSLFLKSNMTLRFESGTKLIGVTDIKKYPEIETRVAGVEMLWPAAIINGINVENVKIEGPGIIDGQGPYWWNLYWGEDQQGGQRKIYDEKNLRWIVDYEVKRPREILIYNSKKVMIQDVTLKQSGFWNLQITYSKNIHVNNVTVRDSNGPSTDGIDIDSSSHVLVENCKLSCGDDCIVIKSGRDGDGWRVNRPSEFIEIKNCQINSGYGVVIGSEISAGVRHVYIHDITFKDSGCGFRMKSSLTRGGIVEDIRVERLSMTNVQFPFSWLMNWHPQYNSKASVKSLSNDDTIPNMWLAVAEQMPIEEQRSKIKNVSVKDVTAVVTDEYQLRSRAFDLQAFSEKPMENIRFENIRIDATEFGNIVAVNDLELNNVKVNVMQANSEANDHYDNR